MITQTSTPRPAAVRRGAEVGAALRGLAWPIGLSALVLLAALLGPAALADPVTGATVGGARLEVGPAYLPLAPVFNVLDSLSLLTLGQHYAVLVTLIATFVAWRVLRRRSPRGPLRRAGIELGVALGALAGLLAFYAYGIVGPRPMAGLVVSDRDVVIVDFHSHTHASHDGRPGFDAARNREWHASAGFDAVYVSDHRTFEGYAEGAARNPSRAGEGTVLLSALEIKFANRYASALGGAWRYRHAMEGNHLIADSLRRSLRDGHPRPTLVLTVPGRLDSIPGDHPPSIEQIGYVAVEVNDASPKGLRQSRRDRQIILDLADSLDLATVASSNHHGWGRTAAAWTLLRIPGWRSMTPQRLGQAIEATLHRERRDAAQVVERRMPYTGETVAGLLPTAPMVAWQTLGGLSTAERLVWLAWIWLGAGLVFALRVRRAVARERRTAEPLDPVATPA